MTDLATTSSSTVRTGDNRWQQLVAEKIAPNATSLDIDYLAAVCRRLELSPFTSPAQIVLVPRYDARLKRQVFRPQVTVDGRLALAVRTGHVVGIEGPEFTGPREKWTRDGQRIWTDLWDIGEEQRPPRAARYYVHVRDWTKPVNGTATWPEFMQTDSNGELLPLWRRMPSVMLAKSALSLALRRSGVEAFAADVAVAYEGDGETVDAAVKTSVDTPGPDENPPPSGPGPHAAHRVISSTADGILTCACGQRFQNAWAWGVHRNQPDDRPPDELYDSAPESVGYDDDIQPGSYEDPGRPFTEES